MQLNEYQGLCYAASAKGVSVKQLLADEERRKIKLLKRRLAYARNVEPPRIFPSIKHQALIEAQGPLLSFNEDGELSSRGLTDWYVTAYCKNNHLKECHA